MRSRNQSACFEAPVRAGGSGADRLEPSVREVPRSGRSSWGRVLLAAALAVAPGCQLNRSFFQMDSDSRVPFFGIDLAPGWSKRGSSVNGVSRLQSEPRQHTPPAETVDSAPPSPRSLTLPLSESVVTTTATDGTPAEAFR